jgi:hypothetical protein
MRIYTFCLNVIFNIIGIGLFCILIITYLSDLNQESIRIIDHDLSYQCQYKILTGKECGSCGLSRSWVSLSNFKFEQARNYNSSGFITFITSHVFVLGYFFSIFINKKVIKNKDFILVSFKSLMILMQITSWYRIVQTNISLETYKILLQ